MQVFRSATLSRLHCVQFPHVYCYLGAKLFTSFLISTIIPLALKCLWNHTYRV